MDKIALENSIFARAACLRVEIASCAGRLCVCSADGYLLCLIALYNECFALENQRWLREDQTQEIEEQAYFFYHFMKEKNQIGW